MSGSVNNENALTLIHRNGTLGCFPSQQISLEPPNITSKPQKTQPNTSACVIMLML